MFQLSFPSAEPNLFQNLTKHIAVEPVGKGRQATILIRPHNDLLPLVRSTAAYQNPSQYFLPIHTELANRLERTIAFKIVGSIPLFNNAMMELYTDEYRTMGYHTDQSLDLSEDSWICLFTCYRNPGSVSKRVLRIKDKATNTERDLVLQHNSFVFFSAKTNVRYTHKIILPETIPGQASDKGNVWLGLTFRTAKTFLLFDRETALFSPDNVPLRIATEIERHALYKMKSEENQKTKYAYPKIDFTVSPGDTKKPIQNENVPSPDEEARFILDNLLVLHDEKSHPDTEFVVRNFAGSVQRGESVHACGSSLVFLAGDIGAISIVNTVPGTVFIIEELSYNYKECNGSLITLGQVPIDVHGLGILFRQYFVDDRNRFALIAEEHQFQNLTESNKSGCALRTGLYISDVTEFDGNQSFHLLRCSSNFTGPTEGLRPTDREILCEVNRTARHYFDNPASLNHVLAQIYNNSKQGKAAIKRHADKTKDMPTNGVMAFCTFYDNNWHAKVRPRKTDQYDRCYNETSVLTRLQFRLKDQCPQYANLPKEFSVTLYSNSVFLMPLSTNRLYTHETCPSALPVEFLPTRMGYVVRCSDTEAVHKTEDQSPAGATYVRSSDGALHKLEPPTTKDIYLLRKLYYIENCTDQPVNYGEVFFSMNGGDYMKPIV